MGSYAETSGCGFTALLSCGPSGVTSTSPTLTSAAVGERALADEATITATRTFKFRLRDKHAAGLRRQARAVNLCWNYCNEVQKRAVQNLRPWLSGPDLMRLTAGAGKELGLHAHTIQRVCGTYDQSRQTQKKAWLRWRSRKSLGWVPFNTGHVVFDGSCFVFRGVRYEAMHFRNELAAGMRFGAGSFSSDAQGRWYINLPVKEECAVGSYSNAVGIDLGLKTLASCSDGSSVEMPRFYRQSEVALASSQRARKTRRARKIHTKIRNRRKDYLHKASLRLVREYGTIIVGDVSAKKLARTRLAKSVHDAAWSDFKNMLRYKAIRHGGRMLEVSEAYSSQVCSACGSMPPSRPKGIADLGKRVWRCDNCETVHDRDVNAARNILRVGLDTLRLGASS